MQIIRNGKAVTEVFKHAEVHYNSFYFELFCRTSKDSVNKVSVQAGYLLVRVFRECMLQGVFEAFQYFFHSPDLSDILR